MAKKSSTIIPLNIELIFDSMEELNNLEDLNEIKEIIFSNSLDIIEKAIKLKKNKVDLFNIYNYSLLFKLDKSQYTNVLETIKQYYLSQEKYETCAKIQLLINETQSK
jgi:hypothetical protein